MGVQLTGRCVEQQMGKPSLVRDISRVTFCNLSQSLLRKMKNPFRTQNQHLEDALKGVVSEENLSDQLSKIAISTVNTKNIN